MKVIDDFGWHCNEDWQQGSEIYVSILETLNALLNNNKKKIQRGEMTQSIKTALVILGHRNFYRVYANRLSTDNVDKIRKIKGLPQNGVCYGEDFVNQEWLFDVIWYREPKDENITDLRNEKYFIKKLFLAIECEWGGYRYFKKDHPNRKNGCKHDNDKYGEVKFDFQKLIVSNATYKIMIFQQQGDDNNLKEIDSYINRQLIEYDALVCGSTILCVAYNKDFKGFRYKIFTKAKQ